MAGQGFTRSEWNKIRETLESDPARYGLPDRVYGSVVLASFNIRKLGSTSSRTKDTWEFLAYVCRRFDLLAVQEIQDELSGLRKLQELMGPEFDMIVSDKTGVFPGEPGVGERLGFIFNRSIVRRTEIATDISYDRSKVLNAISRHNDEIHAAMAPYAKKLRNYIAMLEEFDAGIRSTKPKKPKFNVKMPTFLTFIRAPLCVSFEAMGHPGTNPYQFMAINAHLYYGDYMSDRRQEFDALMEWIIARLRENDKAYYPNFILLGDLNLDFDKPETDRARIEKHLKAFNPQFGDDAHVNFPFLDPHPGRNEVFRTNARLNETFDQIGLFFRDKHFPTHLDNANMGQDERGFDYGVFGFVNLFSEALNNKPMAALTNDAKKKFLARFEHKVSDHMPLWLRLPLP
ncbi:MAG: endonuclease/exonuclease/phosphatase [Candidatus Methylomirabilales bacterium]